MKSTRSTRTPPKDSVVFLKLLAALTRFGVPLPRAVEISSHGSRKRSFRRVIEKAAKLVPPGNSLHGALSPAIPSFQADQTGPITQGERVRVLPVALDSLAEDLNRSAEATRLIRRISLCPVAAVVAFILAALVGILVILPLARVAGTALVELWNTFDTTLPATGFTFFWIAGKLVVDRGLTMLLFLCGALGLIFLGVLFLRSYRRGKLILDRRKLALPLYGRALRSANLFIFCSALGKHLKEGSPLNEAVAATQAAVPSEVFKQEIAKLAQELASGASLSDSMKKSHRFPWSLIRAVAAGESKGRLAGVLLDMADFYRLEGEDGTLRLWRWAEVSVGLLVAVFGLFCVMTALTTVFMSISPFRGVG